MTSYSTRSEKLLGFTGMMEWGIPSMGVPTYIQSNHSGYYQAD